MKAHREDERREFFRMSDRLLVGFRQITYEESLSLEKNAREIISSRNPDPRLLEMPTTPAFIRELYSYLQVLDRKLDAVINVLSKKDELFHTEYLDVDISGSGMRFTSGVKLEEGDCLELRIVLPGFPDVRIGALGRVVRVRRVMSANEEFWEIAIRFAAISERDRDVLINYLFLKERERKRARIQP
jgi:hypothetical protein